ncbi:hypothetical protein MVEN_00969900 [Mycena venus]|uniref:Uncharacterized protein n=1 Tax=Mycena venus TaxID=2733690 RepID=A0A8H6YE52_9AGAR|nr:hypothetical protein MVEN_00969900 [Mycena venus]
MPPLTRQDTHSSIHSYWSDSNPGLQGPTINLHAAAKPLMRLMYHRQVLAFIRKNRGSPLSTPTLEIYLSYFPWNYVSSATKHAILEELIARSASEADARAIVGSPVFNGFVQMLGSTDVGTRISSCRLLSSVARHESNILPILKLGVCHRLATLLRYDNSQVIECTLDALCQVAHWSCPFPTDFLLQDEKMSEHVLKLLKSPLPYIRLKSCTLLGRLSSHRPLWSVVEVDVCEQLASLLGDENSRVAGEATYALTQIGRWSDIEQSYVDFFAWNYVLMSLESPILEVRQWACQFVGSPVGGWRRACGILPSRADAVSALFAISLWPDGVAALANTNIFEELQGLSQLLADVETKVRIHMILDNLAWYKAGET